MKEIKNTKLRLNTKLIWLDKPKQKLRLKKNFIPPNHNQSENN